MGSEAQDRKSCVQSENNREENYAKRKYQGARIIAEQVRYLPYQWLAKVCPSKVLKALKWS